MKRNVSLEEISDGRLYDKNDMVKADCHGCKNCSKCCQGMGSSIILDPYDVYRLTLGIGRSFQELLAGALELNVVDGIILPNLKMVGESERCSFLDEQGRCSIHAHRPGLCRLFPLGRIYEDGDFKFFLQSGECTEPHTKVKVSKWIDTPNFEENRKFVLCWHDLLQEIGKIMAEGDDELRKQLNMLMLNTFYLMPYEDSDFYTQFAARYEKFLQGGQGSAQGSGEGDTITT